jgi:hypothetical protein
VIDIFGVFRLGFTGSRNGMTDAQKKAFSAFISDKNLEFAHGDCIGSDADAHALALLVTKRIIIHPPTAHGMRAFCTPYFKIHAPLPYLRRNNSIVDSTDMLFAVPNSTQEQVRSGTWSTIRYALKQKKPIHIVYPDGTLADFN